MDIRDRAIAALRTLYPVAIGHIVAALIGMVEPLGLSLDSVLAGQVVGWTLSAVVYLLGQWLEHRRGESALARAARFIASVLLGSVERPTYSRSGPERV